MEDSESYLLTRSEALVRSSALSSISYRLRLTLSTEDSYAGILETKFTVSDPSISL